MFVVTAAQMKAADRHTIERLGVAAATLMERVAAACTGEITQRFSVDARVVVLAGGGNNGGDGYAIARQLHALGYRCTVVAASESSALTADTRHQLALARAAGVEIVAQVAATSIRQPLLEADVWVDALLGIGARGPLRGPVAAALAVANEVRAARERRPFVLAVDLPSGLDADTGVVPDGVLRADLTVTVQAKKWGTVLSGGLDCCGNIVVCDVGIEIKRDDVTEIVEVIGAARRYLVPPRSAHKGSQGHVLVVAGSEDMPGAAALSARAAMRAGAGLVTLAAPKSVRALALGRTPELIGVDVSDLPDALDERFDAIVVGPGLGIRAGHLVDRVFTSRGGLPVVVDADALAPSMNHDLGAGVVLTPHPGELARMLGVSIASVRNDLLGATARLRAQTGAVVIAKTAGAIVDGARRAFVEPGSAGMATAGSGDVLAGIVGALVARHDAEAAAVVGAWLHARAGFEAERSVGIEPLLASDIIDGLSGAFAALRAVHA